MVIGQTSKNMSVAKELTTQVLAMSSAYVARMYGSTGGTHTLNAKRDRNRPFSLYPNMHYSRGCVVSRSSAPLSSSRTGLLSAQ